MESVGQTYYIIRLVALALAVVLTLVTMLRQMRARRYNAGKLLSSGALALVALAALALLTRAPVSWIAMGAGAALGAALGFVAGRGSRFTQEGGHTILKRSAAAPLTFALASVLAATTLMFGSAPLFADALALLALAVGMMFGQTASEMGAAGAAQAASPPAEPTHAHEAG